MHDGHQFIAEPVKRFPVTPGREGGCHVCSGPHVTYEISLF